MADRARSGWRATRCSADPSRSSGSGCPPARRRTTSRRAEREARIAAQVNHANVVAVFDFVNDGDHTWLVTEYVEGTTLAQLVRDRGRLTPEEAAPLLLQVADALAAAHRLAIVHRDVKPSNILVAARRHREAVRLRDRAGRVADASLTQTGLVTGSPAYIAPEVATGRIGDDRQRRVVVRGDDLPRARRAPALRGPGVRTPCSACSTASPTRPPPRLGERRLARAVARGDDGARPGQPDSPWTTSWPISAPDRRSRTPSAPRCCPKRRQRRWRSRRRRTTTRLRPPFAPSRTLRPPASRTRRAGPSCGLPSVARPRCF